MNGKQTPGTTTPGSAQTLVCWSVEWKSWWMEAPLSCLEVLALIQQMSSQRLKPHFCRQCRPASRPSALPHLAHTAQSPDSLTTPDVHLTG